MSKPVKAVVSKKQTKEDILRVNLYKGIINLSARMFKYRDKDTRQIVCYIPSLDISSYGSTDKKALDMLDFSLKEYFQFLCSLSQKKLEEELRNLGFKHAALAGKKEFSKVSVSKDGELENFNAVADQVEELTLQA